MIRTEILETANDAITRDRAATHGDAESNFSEIAALWTAWLDRPVTPYDVAMMMVLFKVARAKSNAKHVDNFIDLAGYAALAGEISYG